MDFVLGRSQSRRPKEKQFRDCITFAVVEPGALVPIHILIYLGRGHAHYVFFGH